MSDELDKLRKAMGLIDEFIMSKLEIDGLVDAMDCISEIKSIIRYTELRINEEISWWIIKEKRVELIKPNISRMKEMKQRYKLSSE